MAISYVGAKIGVNDTQVNTAVLPIGHVPGITVGDLLLAFLATDQNSANPTAPSSAPPQQSRPPREPDSVFAGKLLQALSPAAAEPGKER